MDRKTEIPGLYMNDQGVLINKDNDALKAYKLRKAKERKLNTLEKDVLEMKNDLSEIKTLLKQMVT